MWMMTPRGFYSAVQKTGSPPDTITVRARVKKDLENLSDLLPNAKPYRLKTYSDYPWRIQCSVAEWATVCAVLATEIDYSNFKDEVKKRQGSHRASVYGSVWGNLLRLERTTTRWFGSTVSYDRSSRSASVSFGDRWDEDYGECKHCATPYDDVGPLCQCTPAQRTYWPSSLPPLDPELTGGTQLALRQELDEQARERRHRPAGTKTQPRRRSPRKRKGGR